MSSSPIRPTPEVQAPEVTYQLEISIGKGERRTRSLEPNRRLRVGRDPGVEIYINDPNVSRTHCELRVENGVLLLRDSRSLNGTKVNGKLVQEALLQPGDHVELGQTTLVVKLRTEGEAPTARPSDKSGGPLYENLIVIPMQVEESPNSLTSTRIAALRMDNEELKRSYRRLSNAYSKLLTLMTRIANSGAQQTVPQICERFTSALLEAFDTAQCAQILEVDRTTGRYQLVRAQTQTGEPPPPAGPAFDALLRDCIKNRRAISAIDRHRGSLHAGRSMLAVPLIQNREVTGVIYLENANKAYAFDRFDLDLLSVFGFHMGTSLRCVNLFIELDAAQQRAERRAGRRASSDDQQRVDESFGSSEARFRALFEQSAFGAALVEQATGRILEANEGFVRMLGIGRTELERRPFTDLFVNPADAEALLHPLDTAINENERFSEAEMRTNDRSTRTVIAGARRIAFGSGPVVLCYFVDVTSSKRHEAELLTSLRRITSLSSFSQALMALNDPSEICSIIHSHIADEVPVELFVVALSDPAAETLQPVVALRHVGGNGPEVLRDLPSVKVPEPVRRVLDSREALTELRTPRDTNSPHPLLPTVKEQPLFRSRLYVPLAARDTVLGILSIQSSHNHAYDSAQVGYLVSIATLAALAIQNAQLFRATLTQQQDLTRLSNQLLTAQEDERARISRELHDGIGQSLTALRYQLATVRTIARNIAGSETLQNELQESLHLVKSLIEELRTISLDLRPTMLDDLGLAPTLDWLLRQHAQRHSVRVVSTINLGVHAIPPAVASAAFRVSQEALANVAKHARAGTLYFRAEVVDGRLRIEIEDDGQGFDTAKLRELQAERACSGMINMKERARLLGGDFALRSEPGRGTSLTFLFPLEERAAP